VATGTGNLHGWRKGCNEGLKPLKAEYHSTYVLCSKDVKQETSGAAITSKHGQACGSRLPGRFPRGREWGWEWGSSSYGNAASEEHSKVCVELPVIFKCNSSR